MLATQGFAVLDRVTGQAVDPATIDWAGVADSASFNVRYRLRQDPGPRNALGSVKFSFSNGHAVYLHDTPADSLFARATRSFSHGCVRLEDPVALAQYVLRDQPAWTRDKILEAMNAGEERTVKLKASIPVYLGYWTARVRPDGSLQFRPDVYGVDRRQAKQLADRLTRLRKTAEAAATATAGSSTPANERPGAR